jgi:hypothetical protein
MVIIMQAGGRADRQTDRQADPLPFPSLPFPSLPFPSLPSLYLRGGMCTSGTSKPTPRCRSGESDEERGFAAAAGTTGDTVPGAGKIMGGRPSPIS